VTNHEPMTDEEVRAELGVCSAASKPPWTAEETDDVLLKTGVGYFCAGINSVTWDCGVIQCDYQCDCIDEVEQARDDVDFIVAAREGYPLALEEVLRLRGFLQGTKQEFTDIMEVCSDPDPEHGSPWDTVRAVVEERDRLLKLVQEAGLDDD